MYLYSYIVSTFVVLLCIAIGYYRKFFAPYRGLPRIPITTLFKGSLFMKIPKGMTPASFYFQGFMQLLQECQSGGIVYLWFLRPYLFIFGEEAVKLFANEDAAVEKPSIYQIVENIMGKGLLTSNGNVWKVHRKMITPAFGVAMLKDKIPIFNKHSRILVKELMDGPQDSVDILKNLKLCTVSNICETVLGLDMKERKAEVELFVKGISESFDRSIESIFNPWVHFIYSWKYLKEVEAVRDFPKKILLEMKEASLFNQNKTPSSETKEIYNTPQKSLAHRLVELHLKDPSSCSVEYMVDELMTIMIGGYDTIAHTLLWCLFLLGHHQDIQDRVYDELQFVADGDVSFEDLSELTYMECVIKETFRFYPVIPLFARHLKKNVQLGKYNIPKDTDIVFVPYLYHRNPEIYRDPEKFDPERFAEGNTENRPWTLIPFAEGKRSCIGKKMAFMEMKIILVHVLRHFKFTSLERQEDIRLNWNVILNTLEPLHVRLTPRNVDV